MPSYLELTDGSYTADLIWHSTRNRRYMLAEDSWAPVIAGMRKSELGGAGPFAEVEEEIEVNVMGENEAEVLANLHNLAILMDRAERWWRQKPFSVNPVQIKYQIEGSAEMNIGVIVGRAPGDETSGVALPITTHKGVRMLMVERVKIRYRRRGLWFGTTTLQTDSSSAANPAVQTVTLSEAPRHYTPMDSMAFDPTVAASPVSAVTSAVTVLTTSSDNSASRLQIYEAESATVLGTNVASTADAAGKARGGSVARYSPGVLSSLISQNLSGFDSISRRVGVWAAVRNNSSTTNFTIQARVSNSVGGGSSLGPIVPIDAGSLTPRIVFLGIMAPQTVSTVQLNLTASAASGTLDIDYFVVHALDDETSGAYTLIPTAGFGGGGNFAALVFFEQTFRVVAAALSQGSLMGYLGDVLVMLKGAQMSSIVLGTTSTFWVLCDGSNNQVNMAFRIVRRRASLVPL